MNSMNFRISACAHPQLAGMLGAFGLLLTCTAVAAQTQANSNDGTIDECGSVYVPSDDGTIVKVTDTSKCSGTAFTPDRQIFGCRVKKGLRLNGRWESMIPEIYRPAGCERPSSWNPTSANGGS